MRLPLTVLALRAVLIVLFLGLLVAQTLIAPGTLAHDASQDPAHDYLHWPLLVVAIVELLAVQVVVVCTWRLLSMVQADRIFTDAAFVWVDVIVWTIAAAWVLLAGVFLYLTTFVADDPGGPVLMMGMLITGAVVGLLMVVMRALLRQATTLRADMDAVI